MLSDNATHSNDLQRTIEARPQVRSWQRVAGVSLLITGGRLPDRRSFARLPGLTAPNNLPESPMIAWPPCHPIRVWGPSMLLLALGACGGDGRTNPVDIAAITLEPQTVVMRDVGQSSQVTVTALDSDGNPVANPALNWTSSDPDVVTVNGSGRVTAQAFGSAEVTAASGTV